MKLWLKKKKKKFFFAGSGIWTRATLVTGSDADHYARLVLSKVNVLSTKSMISTKSTWDCESR